MKKVVLSLLLAVISAAACVFFASCGADAESITFSETSVTLDSNSTQELTYTAQPENANVKIKISDSTVVKYEKGVLTALTAGTATVKVYSPADESIYSECKVTVNAPSGYSSYQSSGCKFVYPSSWSKTSVTGTLVSYNGNSSANVNLTFENKNNSYFSAGASTFQKTIEQVYSQMGITATFTGCKVDKDKFLGYTRVHVVYDYTARGVKIHQEQMILNSGEKSYVLTVTNATEEQTETIFSEFIGLK